MSSQSKRGHPDNAQSVLEAARATPRRRADNVKKLQRKPLDAGKVVAGCASGPKATHNADEPTAPRAQSRPDLPGTRYPAGPASPAPSTRVTTALPTDSPARRSGLSEHALALLREIARTDDLWPSLHVFGAPSRRGRVTLVSESILPARSTGRTEAGFALAALLARRLDHDLRFLCRQAREGADAMQTLLDITDLDWDADIDFRVDGTRGFDLCQSDLLVTTSWQSTIAVARAFDPRQIVFLVEDDERLLGVSDSDIAGFAAALDLPGLHCVVKSRSLGAYLAAQDLVAADAASCFEPAFPNRLFYQRPRPAASRTLTAFANPACLDDMHDLATVALRTAICAGVLPPDRWTVCLFGTDPTLPIPRLPANVEVVQDTGPLALAELAGRTDIALCMNRKPYASYRPLEMAAGGAMVVGNVSDDLQVDAIRIAPDVTSIVRGIATAVSLIPDGAIRKNHAMDATVHRRWSDALGAAVEVVADWVEAGFAVAGRPTHP